MAASADIQRLEDLVLALAYSPGSKGRIAEPLKGKTVLQKLLFHLRKVVGGEIPSDEIPHFYGPFDEVASTVLDGLVNSGYLSAGADSVIELTSEGRVEAKIVWERKLSSKERDLVEGVKRQFGDLSTDEVLAITYAKYPESAVDSIVRSDLERRGSDLAVGLVRRGRVSVGLGSKIAGIPLKQFLNLLSKRGVPVVERQIKQA